MQRRLLVAGAVLPLVAAGWIVFVAKNYTAAIDYYEVATPQAIMIGVTSAPRAWTRVTQVTESSTEVRIKVEAWDWAPGPGTAHAVTVRLTVQLDAPLGSRTVTDQVGNPVQNPNCTDNLCSASPSP